ncbi:MAG: hypothetical protein K2M17_02005 [Bacilli bacterium]|nr:hypothetical protein [Bacilli bacterium]
MVFEGVLSKLGLDKLRLNNKKRSDILAFCRKSNVVFQDDALLLTLGQWMNILHSRKVREYTDFSVSVPLSIDELIGTVTSKQRNEVVRKFGYLLHLVGIDTACNLYDFDQDTHFKGYISDLQQDVDFAIRWGSWMDSFPELHVDSGDTKKIYDFYGFSADVKAPLVLSSYIRRNPNNGNSLTRFLCEYFYSLTFRCGDSILRFSVDCPNECDEESFYLENEEDFENYLLSLPSPVAVDDIFKKFRELCLGNRNSYPMFRLQIEKAIENKGNDVTGNIVLNPGQVSSFMVTHDEKTASLTLHCGDSILSVSVDSPNEREGETFYLENEESFENYLLGLSVPFAVDDIFKKFSELCLGDKNSYPSIMVKIEKKVENERIDVTDDIALNYGQVTSFIVTRNGKTISLDENNGWSYRTADLSVIKDSESGKMDVNASSLSDLTTECFDITSEVTAASQEVEMIRKLRKKLLEEK